jgi:hypothetical protein
MNGQGSSANGGAVLDPDEYVIPAGTPMQCAWCGRFKGPDGRPLGEAFPLDTGRTHGICRVCLEEGLARLLRESGRAPDMRTG